MLDELSDEEFTSLLDPTPSKPESLCSSDSVDVHAIIALPDPREAFFKLVALRELVKSERHQFVERLREDYETKVERLWRSKSDRGRKQFKIDVAERELDSECREIIAVIKAASEAHRVGFTRAIERIETLITDRADAVKLSPDPSSRVYLTTTDVITYNSQPGKITYARNRALLHKFNLEAMGLAAEVNEQVTGGLSTFDVWVFVAESDLPIVRAKTGARMPDLVRECWRLGSNPRVYWPFLPHGYEAKHGFDEHGRLIAWSDLPGPVQSHCPEPPKISESQIEPEIV